MGSPTNQSDQAVQDAPPPFLFRPEVEKACRLSRSAIYRLMGEGKFPRPIRVGTRRVAWRPEDIAKWVRDGVASVGTTDPEGHGG